MTGKINWKKKNGNEMETNDLDATVKYMESVGATRVAVKKVSNKLTTENKQTVEQEKKDSGKVNFAP